MNKAEMIEEMAKDTGGCDVSHRECSKCWRLEERKCSAYVYAKKLIEQGYRKGKIPKGSVVLDRQEYQEYCAYKIIEPQIKGCLDRERELKKQVKELEEQRDRQAYIAEELIQEKHRWTEQARKETAKEIYKEYLSNILSLEAKEEFAQQFAIEVE